MAEHNYALRMSAPCAPGQKNSFASPFIKRISGISQSDRDLATAALFGDDGRRSTVSMPVRRGSRAASPPMMNPNQQCPANSKVFCDDVRRSASSPPNRRYTRALSPPPFASNMENSNPNMRQSQADAYAKQKWSHPPIARTPVAKVMRRSLARARQTLAAPTPKSALQLLAGVLLVALVLYLARHAIDGVLLVFTLKMLAASPSCEAVWVALILGFVYLTYRSVLLMASLERRYCGCRRRISMRR